MVAVCHGCQWQLLTTDEQQHTGDFSAGEMSRCFTVINLSEANKYYNMVWTNAILML